MLRSLLALAFFHIASSHREHKVHNIVLYPEKHSWCKTTPIKEVVGHPGCEAIEVDNNVCVGACFSYSIPRTEPTAPGEVAPYCDSCQPSKVVWKHVTLKCPDNENETMLKRVEVIEDCSCLTCRQESEHTDTNEASAMDVPSILNIMSAPIKATNSSHLKHGSKLGQLLKMLAGADDETVDDLDGKTTEQRLENLIEEMRSKGVNEEELQGLAEKSEGTGQVKVDLNKLKLLLSRIEGGQESASSEDDQEDEGETLDLTPQHPRPHHMPHEHSKVPTLEVAPHHLRPTVEGEELTYLPQHNHHHHKKDDFN